MGQAQQLSSRAIMGEFWLQHDETARAAWTNDIAIDIDSDQASETHKWLHTIPAMQEWTGSRRQYEPRADGVTIINRKFENGLHFSKDDLRRDKTPQTMARIGDLGARAAQLPQKLVTETIEANANAYDNAALFANHTAISVINNAQTQSVSAVTAPTTAEMATAITTLLATIKGALDEHGEPSNESAMRFLLMVPTLYMGPAEGVLANEFTSAGVSNTVRAMLRRVQIDLVVNPRLAIPSSSGVFYLFRTDGRTKPFIWQEEEETTLQTLAEGSDYEVLRDGHFYGAKRICAAGSAFFEMACRMTFS